MRTHLLLTSALAVALGLGQAFAQSGTTGGTGSTTGSTSPSSPSTTTPSTTTPSTTTPGTTTPMNTSPGATGPLPPAGSGTPPINPNTTLPTTDCVVGTDCATDRYAKPIPPSGPATGSAGAARPSGAQPARATSPAGTSGTRAPSTATTSGASFNAELCPATVSGGCAPTGSVATRTVAQGTRLHRVSNPTQTLTGRAIFDGKGEAIGQVANVRLRNGRPVAVVVVLNDGDRVTLRSSRVVYLSENNALATRMTPAQIERLKRLN